MTGPWSPGATVGTYRLEQEIGRGGMGVVFGARDLTTGAPVVIKTLSAIDAEEVARLEREGLALARLRHPNLVLVHGAGWHGRRPYLVLQFASGGSLDARLKQGPLPWPEAAELGAQLAGALAAAHGVGITHRDLKPANVLLDEGGRPLLADFGLARVSDLSRMTETGALLGTPLYMAPEQALGIDSGAAADIYSLGALLYAAIAGRPPIPVQAGGVVAQLMALQEDTPPRLGTLAEVPQWLEELIHHTLARDPQRRPSAEEVRARLLAPPPEAASSRRAPVLALLGSLSCLAAAGAWAVFQGDGGPVPGPTTTTPAPSTTPSPPTPSPSQDARRGAYPLMATLRGDLHAHLQQLKERTLADQEHSPEDARFLRELSGLDVAQLGLYAPDFARDDAPQRQRRAAWAALELCLRGYLDWLAPTFRGISDVRESLPMVTRLARSGHCGAQRLLLRLKTFRPLPETVLAYQDAYDLLSTATALDRTRTEAALLVRAGAHRARSTEPPTRVGDAWLRVYLYEGLDPLSKAHRDARVELKGRTPSAALPLYLKAWRERESDSESLALELAVAADWKWARHLSHIGHPFTAGLPPPERSFSREDLRADIRLVLNEVEWARAHYYLALTYLPKANPTTPHPRPPDDLGPLLAALERALELDPGLSPALLLRATLYRWQGDRASALDTIRLLACASPSWRAPRLRFEALLLLEDCHEGEGPMSPALRELYLEARQANKAADPGWIKGHLEVLYRGLERRE